MSSVGSPRPFQSPPATISGDLVLDALPAAAYVCDVSGIIIRYNRRAEELWGRQPRHGDEPDKFCGSHRLFRLDGETLPHKESPMAEALTNASAIRDREVVMQRLDGERLTVLLSINPLLDDHGVFLGAVGSFTDVSYRRVLEEQLRVRQSDLEDFFDNGAVALHWVGPDGFILRANQAELTLMGYRREDYVGRHITEFHADRPAIDDILLRLSRGEKLDKYPASLRTRSGDIRHVLISSNVCMRDGQFSHTRCFTIDITDRYMAEAAVREADRQSCDRLAALPAAVYTTDEKGAITFYNEAAAELWGARPKLGTSHWCGSWRLCWPDGTPLPHDEWPMTIALREGRAVRNVEAVIERPDGTRVPCMPYPTPLRDAEDRLVGAINMIIDLTHLKAASERQQLLINELNHRVKNTLATVQSIGYQTFNGKVDGQLQRQFDNRLIALGKTHDVLTQENWAGADLRELLTKSIAFACDADDRATLNGPAIMLPQKTVVPLAMAIHELCTNASKYGALTKSEGRITIDWRLLEDGQRLVLRWVESGGPVVTSPDRRGFGTRLLQRGLAHELRATVDLEFASSGVTCEIDFRLTAWTATH